MEIDCPMCKYKFEPKKKEQEAELICGKQRPARDVLCQLKHPHSERHCAVIFWEDEMK